MVISAQVVRYGPLPSPLPTRCPPAATHRPIRPANVQRRLTTRWSGRGRYLVHRDARQFCHPPASPKLLRPRRL